MSATTEACVENISPRLVTDSVPGPAEVAKHQRIGMRGLSTPDGAPHIVCVYVDAFFATVEQALQSRLRGKATVVACDRVVSASHQAKLRGVAVGMTIPQVLERCAKVIVVSGRYGAYAEYAERVRRILESFTPAVDPNAHHGFYLSFFGSPWLTSGYPDMLRRLQLEILKKTGLGVSIGAGRTRVVAGLAARLERGRGLRIVKPEAEQPLLASLPVDALHGMGGIDAGNLRKRGISTIAELQRVPLAALCAVYGEIVGRQIWDNSRGNDRTPARTKAKPGYVSREVNVDGGTMDAGYLSSLLEYLCERISCALRDTRRQVRTIAVRVRYADHFTASQSLRLPGTGNDEDEFRSVARRLLRAASTREVAVRSLEVSAGSVVADSDARSIQPATAAIA